MTDNKVAPLGQFDTKDKTLKGILKEHRYSCSSNFCKNGSNPTQSCMDYARIEKAFEKGKTAGRDEALKVATEECQKTTASLRHSCLGYEQKITALEERLKTEKQTGHEEYQKMFLDGKWQCEKVETHFVWQVVCYDCNKEKIAALEAENTKLRAVMEKKGGVIVLAPAEQVAFMDGVQKELDGLKKENARLRDVLEKLKKRKNCICRFNKYGISVTCEVCEIDKALEAGK